MAYLQVFGVMLAFGSILFLAVISTRLLAGKTKRAMKGQYINIIETVSLGLDKQIHLLKVDNQFVLISTAGKRVEFLTNIDMNNYGEQETASNNLGAFDFKSLFEKHIQAYKDKKSGKSADSTIKGDDGKIGENAGNREFAFTANGGEKFKSNLGRIKTITSVMYKQGELDGDEGTNEK